MKKLFLISFLCGLALLADAATVTVTNLVTYGASGGASTNYGTPVYIGAAIVPLPPNVLFSHGALVTNTAAYVNVQIGTSPASNMMTTVATIYPSTTNAWDETYSASSLTLSIYLQTVVVTTNNSTVGTKALFSAP